MFSHRLKNRPPVADILLIASVLMACAAVAGEQYHRDLRKLASAYGFAPPVSSGERVILGSSFTTMIFQTNTRKLYLNGVLVWMNNPLTGSDSRWLLSALDAEKVVDPLLRPDNAVSTAGNRLVVIDPGHGGRDPGTKGRRNTLEKKLTLDIAKRVESKLKAQQVAVRLSRSTDVYLSLPERCDKAAGLGADVFVSIHANFARDSAVSGVETFLMTPPGGVGTTGIRSDQRAYRGNRYDSANMVLGYYVHKGLLSCTRANDRGIKRARFEVLKNINCPALLVECGFLSNSREEAQLIDPRYRDAVAEGIARGIATYVRRVGTARPVIDGAQ